MLDDMHTVLSLSNYTTKSPLNPSKVPAKE